MEAGTARRRPRRAAPRVAENEQVNDRAPLHA